MGAEDRVHESPAARRGEIDRFGDRRVRRDAVRICELIQPEAQGASRFDVDLCRRPAGVQPDQIIKRDEAFDHTVDERRVQSPVRSRQRGAGERGLHLQLKQGHPL